MAWTLGAITRKRVTDISTNGVRELISAPDSRKFIIVDVRSNAEVSVSLIPGAITRPEFESSVDRFRDHKIIAYCTIGGRSLLYAHMSLRQGFDCVNYREGILGWSNSQQPLVGPEGEATAQVHTHNQFFKAPHGYTRRL